MGGLAAKLAPRSAEEPILVAPAKRLFARQASGAATVHEHATVGICIADPAQLIETLVALDGRIPKLVLLSHALAPAVVDQLVEMAGCTALISDRGDLSNRMPPEQSWVILPGPDCETQWLMTTSGTTGLPKLVPHSLHSLSRTVQRANSSPPPRWGLLYDPTRFAGMQVVLQALIGGGVLVAPDMRGSLQEQIAFLRDNGCTHLSATPTLWRRILMAPGFDTLSLRQVTLGGEIVDQPVLDRLRAAFPSARMTHIYASTEAGVGFSVTDGKAGFPVRYLDGDAPGCSLKAVDEVLWLRPPASAKRRLSGTGIEVDQEGFIRSGDQIRLTEDRAYFLGRDNGMINVGGVKIYPEAVEQTIMAVPGVNLVRISSKKSPIAGALVVAEVMVADDADPVALKPAILTHCRATLEREAVPAIVRFVQNMELNAAGKLIRK